MKAHKQAEAAMVVNNGAHVSTASGFERSACLASARGCLIFLLSPAISHETAATLNPSHAAEEVKLLSMSRNNESNCPPAHTVPTQRVASDIATAATTELDGALINMN
ncbi:unnamed protein product [Aphanomyces euteiches]|nr:hypothetical protein AeRB84_021072 [Aphanomyces euteiches]